MVFDDDRARGCTAHLEVHKMGSQDIRDFAAYKFAGHEFQAVQDPATLLRRDGHTTEIWSCGSTWGGECPKHLDTLLAALDSTTLDRLRFGASFAKHDGDTWHFFGNFLDLSHVFRITSDDPVVTKALRSAIRRNQHRPDYRAQIAKAS